MKEQIEVITYEQDRLYFFVDQVSLAQKKYNRLFKTFKDAPYLSEGAQFLSDAGRELQFYKDIVELLDKGYRKQEWISVEDEFPDVDKLLGWDGTAMWFFDTKGICEYLQNVISKNGITHWLPIPEPPKMKGGEADA